MNDTVEQNHFSNEFQTKQNASKIFPKRKVVESWNLQELKTSRVEPIKSNI